MESAAGAAAQKRPVGTLLGVGKFFLPIVFVWRPLKPGYSGPAPVVGFGWLALSLLCCTGLIMGGCSAPPRSGAATASGSTASGASASAVSVAAPRTFAIGDVIKSGPLEVTMVDVLTTINLESLPPKHAADGKIYVIVHYRLRNGSREPVKLSQLPHDLHLMDPKGATYSADADATAAAAAAAAARIGDNSINGSGDLGPGVSGKGVSVFEVAQDYDSKTWRIVFGPTGDKIAM